MSTKSTNNSCTITPSLNVEEQSQVSHQDSELRSQLPTSPSNRSPASGAHRKALSLRSSSSGVSL